MKGIRFVIMGILLGAALHAQSQPKLGIIPFTGGTVQERKDLADLLTPELRKTFTLVFVEENQDGSPIFDADTLAAQGQRYGVEFVLSGHIQTLENNQKLGLISLFRLREEFIQQTAGFYLPYKKNEKTETLKGGISQKVKQMAEASLRDSWELPQLAALPWVISPDKSEEEVVAQVLLIELANAGKYAVMPPNNRIRELLEKNRIPPYEFTSERSLHILGNTLKVPYVLAGSIRPFGKGSRFSLAIVSSDKARKVLNEGINYADLEDALSKIEVLRSAFTKTEAAPALRMIFIEGGDFKMGGSLGNQEERPVHGVRVDSFYIGQLEVTQKEWYDLMGTKPSYFQGDPLPVEQVSWYDAIRFCNKKSEKEGLTPAYTINGTAVRWNSKANGYRLPTEAEWEYAAKGGRQGDDSIGFDYAGGNEIDDLGWYYGNSQGKTNPVGSKGPNGLGIYDMNGNVWEWCWDWYDPYQPEEQVNPQGGSSGTDRAVRGGSWANSAEGVRSTRRFHHDPGYRSGNLGFRVVRSAQ